jgi:hypothetical protein
LDYFEVAGAVLSVAADEAEESVDFLVFLADFFLAGLAGVADESELDAAGVVEEGAGVCAKAETANKPATSIAISFFMCIPLCCGQKSMIRTNQSN